MKPPRTFTRRATHQTGLDKQLSMIAMPEKDNAKIYNASLTTSTLATLSTRLTMKRWPTTHCQCHKVLQSLSALTYPPSALSTLNFNEFKGWDQTFSFLSFLTLHLIANSQLWMALASLRLTNIRNGIQFYSLPIFIHYRHLQLPMNKKPPS